MATSLLQKSVVPQLTALTLNTENMRSGCMAEDLEKATRNKDKTSVVMVGAWKFGIVQGLCFNEVGFEGTGTNWFLKKHCCACNGISLFMYQIRSEASQFHTHPASSDTIYIYR